MFIDMVLSIVAAARYSPVRNTLTRHLKNIFGGWLPSAGA